MRVRHARALAAPPAVLANPVRVPHSAHSRLLCAPSLRRCRWGEPLAPPRCPPLGGGPRRTLAIFAPHSEEDRSEREAALAIPKEERDAQVAELDEQIKALTRRRAVLTGELYTLRGKFKSMGRDYGLPFMVWWTAVWLCTGVGVFAGITVSSARRLLHGAPLALPPALRMRLTGRGCTVRRGRRGAGGRARRHDPRHQPGFAAAGGRPNCTPHRPHPPKPPLPSRVATHAWCARWGMWRLRSRATS